jgi:hypothetical protein
MLFYAPVNQGGLSAFLAAVGVLINTANPRQTLFGAITPLNVTKFLLHVKRFCAALSAATVAVGGLVDLFEIWDAVLWHCHVGRPVVDRHDIIPKRIVPGRPR